MSSPTVVFSDQSENVVFPDFSIVGLFSTELPKFVKHVALMDGDNSLPNEVRVYHMGPPLVSNPRDGAVSPENRLLTPHLAVTLNLNEDQLVKLARWAARIATEEGPVDERRNTILPAVRIEYSETGQPKFHRFSCAGYVFAAMQQIDIPLCDEQAIPTIGTSLLQLVYRDLNTLIDRPKLRKYMGIGSDAPWPVLLPGYLFHGADHFLAGHPSLKPEVDMAHYPHP